MASMEGSMLVIFVRKNLKKKKSVNEPAQWKGPNKKEKLCVHTCWLLLLSWLIICELYVNFEPIWGSKIIKKAKSPRAKDQDHNEWHVWYES